MTFQHPAFNIFHHHDAVVYQQSQRHDQSDNAELVQVDPEKIQQNQSDGQGEREWRS